MKFVDIRKNSERKFIPLNEKKETIFNSIINADSNPSLKAQILLEVLCTQFGHPKKIIQESKLKSKNNLVDDKFNKLKGFSAWDDFRSTGKVIADIIGVSQQDIDEKLDVFAKQLIQLGVNTPNDGMKYIEEVDSMLNSSDWKGGVPPGLSSLEPKLDSSFFLKLVAQGRADGIRTFHDLIMTRDSRKLANILTETGTVFTKNLHDVFVDAAKSDKNSIQTIEQAFNSLLGVKEFKKHKNEIGKGEISLALTFSDCALADEQGDIQSNGNSIEVKGSNSGVITSRFSPSISAMHKLLTAKNTPKGWDQIAPGGKNLNDRNKNNILDVINKYNVEFNAFATLNMSQEERYICYAYLFGKSLIEYKIESRYDKIIIVNTQESKNISATKIVVVNAPPVKDDKYEYYKIGKQYLTDAKKSGLGVSLASRSTVDSWCFKVRFTE